MRIEVHARLGGTLRQRRSCLPRSFVARGYPPSAAGGSLVWNYEVAEELPASVRLLLPDSQIPVEDALSIGKVGPGLALLVDIAPLLHRSNAVYRSRVGFTGFRHLVFHVLAKG